MDFKLNTTNLIIGKAGSGKSHLVKYIVYSLACAGEIDCVIVYTNTAFNGDYEKFIPTDYIHPHFTAESLKNIMDHQKNLIDAGTPKNLLLILDDVLGDVSWDSKEWLNYITQFRHYKITNIICSQHANRLNSTTRENCHFAYLFKQFTKRAKLACFESFGLTFPDEKEFSKFLDENTKDYAFLKVDLQTSGDGVYESMICPAEIPEFKLDY